MNEDKCPACGYSKNNDIPLTELFNYFTPELSKKIKEMFNVMKAHHQYDGPYHYKMFLQGISNCEPEIIESVIRKWLADKIFVTKGLPYLRGWIIKENENHHNKKQADLATYGCQPPIIEEREKNGTERNGKRNAD